MPAKRAVHRFLAQFPASLKLPTEDVLSSFLDMFSMLADADEQMTDPKAKTLNAPTLVLHAADSLGGSELLEPMLPRDSVMMQRWGISVQQQLKLAAARDARNEWRMGSRWYAALHEVLVPGDHLSCLFDAQLAQQSLQPVQGFLAVADVKIPCAARLPFSSRLGAKMGALVADASVPAVGEAPWYEHAVRWVGVQPTFSWADNVDDAVAIWVTACSVPPLKREVQYAILVIDTVLLQENLLPHSSDQSHPMGSVPLSAYRSYATRREEGASRGNEASSTTLRERHAEPWLFLALLKALAGEDISLLEVNRPLFTLARPTAR